MDESFKRSFALDTILQNNKNESREVIEERLMAQWYRIVCQYTTLNVTFYTDIFPAVAGIAQKFAEATNFTYIAGLWLEHVLSGLLWYAETAQSREYAEFVAPSWSWASLGGPVRMLFPAVSEPKKTDFDAKVVGTELEYRRDDRSIFLGPEKGKMNIEAHYVDVWCRSSSKGHAPYSDPYLRMTLDVFDTEGVFCGTGYYDRIPPDHTFKSTALVISSRVTLLGTERTHFDRGDRVSAPLRRVSTYFLLVREVEEGIYQRTGVGQTIDDTHGFPGRLLNFKNTARKCFNLV